MGFTMYVPTKILFGQGALDNLHKEDCRGVNAMIVLSNGVSAKKYGYLDKVEEQLSLAKVNYAVFDKVQANPLKDTVMEGAKFCRENKCDFVVALGGGSVMDAAKAIASMATNKGDLWDYVFGGTGKGKALVSPPLPIIAITTRSSMRVKFFFIKNLAVICIWV